MFDVKDYMSHKYYTLIDDPPPTYYRIWEFIECNLMQDVDA